MAIDYTQRLKDAQFIAGVDMDGAKRNVLVNKDGTVAVAGPGSTAAVPVGIPVVPGVSASTTAATLAQGTKAVTTTGTPVLLVASTTLVESVVIQAQKGVATANTGNIYIGFSASGGSNLLVLVPGASLSLQAPSGKKIDLHTIYVDAATNADAVAWTSVN